MARTIAKVYGTAIVPGVSRNGRLYTAEVIAKAVKRAQARLSAGESLDVVRRGGDPMADHPLTQRTHHASDDDSTRIVGRLTALSLDDRGAALFEAEIADTPPGRTIANLIDTEGDSPPFLRGVSIRGAWLGPTRSAVYQGMECITGDDLELDGLDYTHKPGVPGAVINRTERVGASQPQETASGRVLIYESVQEARVADAVEETTPAPAPPTQETTPAAAPVFADNGYLGEKRWPLGTLQEAVEAHYAITDEATLADYSAAQIKRMRGRVAKRLGDDGVTVTSENYLLRRESTEQVAEGYGYIETPRGHVSVSIGNGDLWINVRSEAIDPHDLDLVSRRAMDGACKALGALGGDGKTKEATESGGDKKSLPPWLQKKDGAKGKKSEDDADDKDSDDEDDDEDEDEKKKKSSTSKKSKESTPDPAAASVVETTNQEDPAVSETQTPAAESAPAAASAPVTLSAEQFQQLLAAAQAPAAAQESTPAAPAAVETPAAPATPATPVAQESVPAAPAQTPAERVAALEAELEAARKAAQPQETQEQMIARLVAEGVKAALPGAVQGHVEQHGVPRKGLIESRGAYGVVATEAVDAPAGLPASWPQKPLHLYTEAERAKFLRPAMEAHVMGSRSVQLRADATG